MTRVLPGKTGTNCRLAWIIAQWWDKGAGSGLRRLFNPTRLLSSICQAGPSGRGRNLAASRRRQLCAVVTRTATRMDQIQPASRFGLPVIESGSCSRCSVLIARPYLAGRAAPPEAAWQTRGSTRSSHSTDDRGNQATTDGVASADPMWTGRGAAGAASRRAGRQETWWRGGSGEELAATRKTGGTYGCTMSALENPFRASDASAVVIMGRSRHLMHVYGPAIHEGLLTSRSPHGIPGNSPPFLLTISSAVLRRDQAAVQRQTRCSPLRDGHNRRMSLSTCGGDCGLIAGKTWGWVCPSGLC